ncbi:MAG: radical SAM/SPASM domain-containing protein [Gaiellaceae bacterium]
MKPIGVISHLACLSSAAEQQLAEHFGDEPLDVTLAADPADLSAGSGSTLLLHVPSGSRPEPEVAAGLAARSHGGDVGLLSDDAGVALVQAGAERFARLFAPRDEQADASAYAAGGDARDRWESGAGPALRQVYLGLTQRCNRSCSFCVSRTFDYDLLSLEEVERLANEMAAARVSTIALTGAGEAMTHPDFWAALDLLHAKLPEATFKMNTSGVALIRNAERLLRYPVKNITVSLNAGTQATYERFVGRGYDAVLRGIDAVAAERVRAARSDLRLCLSVVLMSSTILEMPKVVDLAFRFGVEEVQGIYLMVNDGGLADESPWHRQAGSNRWLAATARRGAALGIETSLPPRFGVGDSSAGTTQRTSLPTTQRQACVEAWSTTYIRPDGEVLPCPYFERSLGSIREAPLTEVWKGARYEELRESLASRSYADECSHCCGFNEGGTVEDYESHWLGTRKPLRGVALPMA